MLRLAVSMIAAVTLVASLEVHAQAPAEPAPARLLAAGCVGCHGTDGRSEAGGVTLAGLNEAYFIAQMDAFKTGQRPATVMHQLAKGYGNTEIAALARYFAAQRR